MNTALLLMSLSVTSVMPSQDVYSAPQRVAPLQMIYDATEEDLEQIEPLPLIVAQAQVVTQEDN